MEAVHESAWEENLSSGSEAGAQQLAATGKGGRAPGRVQSHSVGGLLQFLCRGVWGGWHSLPLIPSQVCSCAPLETLHQMFIWESVGS